jgi:4-hydroxy-tetrahydrodipicolinate synthase
LRQPVVKGVYANLPTALNGSGEAVDSARMREYVQWILGNGVAGLSCLLSSGGFTYLTAAERAEVIAVVAREADSKVPVLAGVSGETTTQTIDLAKAAFDAGCDVAMVQPRSYVALSEDEALAHFAAVAAALDGNPIGIYNNPATTGLDISSSLYARIVRETGAVVTKDGSGQVFNVPDVMARCGTAMTYLWGTEFTLLAGLTTGADGCCLALASVFPAEVGAIYDLATSGDLKAGNDAYRTLLPILRAFKQVGTARAVKEVARLRGFELGAPRKPLSRVGPADLKVLADALVEVQSESGHPLSV